MKMSRLGVGSERAGFQRGAYTIFFVAVLGLLTLLAVRSMTTSTINSVRLTSNTHSGTEAFLAAEEAMAQGMEWLASSSNSYTTHLWPAATQTVATPLSFTVANMGGQTTTRDYTLSFGFQAGPAGQSSVKVIGRAINSSGQLATVSQWVSLNTLLQSGALDAPLVVAGCFNVESGVPDIYADTVPHSGTLDYITYYRGPTRRTTLNGSVGETCDEAGSDSVALLNSHNTGTNSGKFAHSAEPVGLSQYSGGDLWPRIFTESRDWFNDLRVSQPSALASMNVYYWDDAGNIPDMDSAPDTETWPASGVIQKSPNGQNQQWPNRTSRFDYTNAPDHGETFYSWGTFANPAVIIYRGGCPSQLLKHDGNRPFIIIGLLYMESAGSNPENADLACTADQWQRFMLLGSLVVNGDLKISQKNPEIISAEVGNIYNTALFPVTGVYGMAGTWKVQGD